MPIAHPPDRGWAGHRDVAAQAHEDTAPDAAGDAGGGPVGRQSFGGRAEVQADAARNADGAVARVELHVLIADDPPERPRWDRRAGPHLVQVGVVPECSDGVADRRIHGPSRPFGRLDTPP